VWPTIEALPIGTNTQQSEPMALDNSVDVLSAEAPQQGLRMHSNDHLNTDKSIADTQTQSKKETKRISCQRGQSPEPPQNEYLFTNS
jgi:hypothetical protein